MVDLPIRRTNGTYRRLPQELERTKIPKGDSLAGYSLVMKRWAKQRKHCKPGEQAKYTMAMVDGKKVFAEPSRG